MNLIDNTGTITHVLYMKNQYSAKTYPAGYRMVNDKNKNLYHDVLLRDAQDFIRDTKLEDYPTITISEYDGLSEEEKRLSEEGKLIFLVLKDNNNVIYKYIGNEHILEDLDMVCSNFHTIMSGLSFRELFSIVQITDINYSIDPDKEEYAISCTFTVQSALSPERIVEILNNFPQFAKYVDIDSEHHGCTYLIISISGDLDIELTEDQIMKAITMYDSSMSDRSTTRNPNNNISNIAIYCACNGKLAEYCTPSFEYAEYIPLLKECVTNGILEISDKTSLDLFVSKEELSRISFKFEADAIHVYYPLDPTPLKIKMPELSRSFWEILSTNDVHNILHRTLGPISNKTGKDYSVSSVSLSGFGTKGILYIKIISNELPF